MTTQQIKDALNQCISALDEMKWLFVESPGVDFSRNRCLTFRKMIRLFLEMQSKSMDKELLEFFEYSTDVPSESAFSQQRSKILPDAFQMLFYLFNEEVPFNKQLDDGYDPVAVDGSNISIAYNPLDQETFIKPENDDIRGYNCLHLNAYYHLLERRYISALIQPCHSKDEKAALCSALGSYHATDPGKTIIIADCGYFSYNVLANLQEHGFRYIIRAKDVNSSTGTLKTYSEIPKAPDAEFDMTVARYLTRSQTRIMLEQDTVYKNIDKAIPFDYLDDNHKLYLMKFRVVRFKLDDNSYEVIVTNLPEDKFPPQKLKRYYHLRWGIESSFRELKYTIGLSRLHGRKRGYAEQEIFARLILYNFCEAVTSQVVINEDERRHPEEKEKKYAYQVNHSMAVVICRKFLTFLDSGTPIDVEKLISKYVVPIRPDRHYERNMEAQGFVSFTYRPA